MEAKITGAGLWFGVVLTLLLNLASKETKFGLFIQNIKVCN